MRKFVASVMVVLGCTAVSTVAAEDRAAPLQEPQTLTEANAVPEGEYRPGLKRSLSGVDETYQQRGEGDRSRLSVEERAIISRELRQVLENVYDGGYPRR